MKRGIAQEVEGCVKPTVEGDLEEEGTVEVRSKGRRTVCRLLSDSDYRYQPASDEVSKCQKGNLSRRDWYAYRDEYLRRTSSPTLFLCVGSRYVWKHESLKT